MLCLGLRNKGIADYYKLEPSTVQNIIRIDRKRRESAAVTKKKGRKQKLSERSLRMFKKYVVQNCFEPTYAIVAHFSADTDIKISESTGRRYLNKMNIQCYVAIQKPFLSKKNISARIQWALIHKDWKQEK